MINKIIYQVRIPGHASNINLLKESGFFDKKDIKINGVKIKPIDFTAKLLLPLWHLEENEKEFTVLQIIISGKEGNKHKEHLYELFDRYDEKAKITSMARTT